MTSQFSLVVWPGPNSPGGGGMHVPITTVVPLWLDPPCHPLIGSAIDLHQNFPGTQALKPCTVESLTVGELHVML